MKLLQKFYADFQTRDEVKAYLLLQLKDTAGNKALQGEDTKGFKEAKECIETCFRDMEYKYKEKEPRKPTSAR